MEVARLYRWMTGQGGWPHTHGVHQPSPRHCPKFPVSSQLTLKLGWGWAALRPCKFWQTCIGEAAACGSRGRPPGTQTTSPVRTAHSTSGSSTWPPWAAPGSCQTWGKSQNQPPMVNKTPWVNHPPAHREPCEVALRAQQPGWAASYKRSCLVAARRETPFRHYTGLPCALGFSAFWVSLLLGALSFTSSWAWRAGQGQAE